MRLPFVSAATYDWAIRHSERLADEADRTALRESELLASFKALNVRIAELTQTIVDMKKQNFVVDTPITSTPLSVDEADEYAVAEEEARPALLKRKLV